MNGDRDRARRPLLASIGCGRSFRALNGRVFESVVARLEKRPIRDLYHSALVVRVPEGGFVIEQAPRISRRRRTTRRRRRRRGRQPPPRQATACRYEIRCWRGGVIPDVNEAVESPRRLTDEPVPRAAPPRARSPTSRPGLGTRRARCRRDVELELGDLLADRTQRTRTSMVRASAPRRTCSRLAGRRGGGAASDRTQRGALRLDAVEHLAQGVGELLDAFSLERLDHVVVVDSRLGERCENSRASSTPSVSVSRTAP